MTETTPAPHQQCSCSRNRKCAFHQGQINRMKKVARPVIDAQKVEMGIEELHARYAKPEREHRPMPGGRANRGNRERSGKNGWR